MKVRTRDYFFVLWDVLLGSWLKRWLIKLRYFLEMGGKGGFEINGAPGYWGRYGALEKIVELATRLKGENDDISFSLPAVQYNLKYSHRINIWGSDNPDEVLVEFIYASDQCGSYEKIVGISALLEELKSLVEAQRNIEEHGYRYVEY